MISFSQVEDSADYSLVMSLVGMVCRFIYQPIEEVAFVQFSSKTERLPDFLGAATAIGLSGYAFA